MIGFGLQSNVTVQNLSPKKLMLLNDTANHVQFGVTSNEVTNITYIDLPVSFKYTINDRWAINAGIQLSLFQDFKTKTDSRLYGFQTDISKVITPEYITSTNPGGGMGGGLRAYQPYDEKYNIRKSNWRFITGINYQLRKMGIKVQYQWSFTPSYTLFDFQGIHTSKKLSLLTVGAYYQVW